MTLAKIPRNRLLSQIPVKRLARIAEKLQFDLPRRPTKETIVSVLSRSRKHVTRAFLEPLTSAELRRLCMQNGISTKQASKIHMVALLSGDETALLRHRIQKSLKAQGFSVVDNEIRLPESLDKDDIRSLHANAVSHKRDLARKTLGPLEPALLKRIASGVEVTPSAISPKLVEVLRGSEDELLFRYVCLHWSIPVSSGYGRRLRYLLVDQSNDKLIGIIGLGDPVFALSARDQWIGWTRDQRGARLHNVLDTFVIGAVPPYSMLLGGKLTAMAAAANEVRHRFREKYAGQKTTIGGKTIDGNIALLTTTSALGRSSIYNRIRYLRAPLFHSTGFTQGYGEFQFLNGLYEELTQFAKYKCNPTAKHDAWGNGFRNRREVVKKCLDVLNLSPALLYHGIRREVFVVPLASNAREFLQGTADTLTGLDAPLEQLFHEFKYRWLEKREQTDRRFCQFDRQSYRLW